MSAVKRTALQPGAGRLPPHDLGAEGIVLSAVLLAEEAFDRVSDRLRPEHFYSDSNRRIFEACCALRERSQAIDVVAVATVLRDSGRLEQVGGTPYLGSLTDAQPAVFNLEQHGETVIEKWRQRRFIETSQRLVAEAYESPEGGTDQLIQTLDSELTDLATRTTREGLEHLHEISTREIELLAHARESGKASIGISTGFRSLDDKTTGLHPGDLYIVAGRPGMGKTAFAANIAANVTRLVGDVSSEDGLAFFSLEMPREQIALRFLCAEEDIEFNRVRTGKLSLDEWSRLESVARQVAGWPLWIDDTPAVSLFEIRSRLRKLKRDVATKKLRTSATAIRVVVIDYLQLMRGTGDSREQEISGITRGLKQLAKEERVAVVALSQLNRNLEKKGGKDKRPQLSDLRESGAIEQDADTVLFMYREEYYDQQARQGDSEVIIGKQRNGPTMSLPFEFRKSGMRFFERAPKSYEDFSADFEDFAPPP